jgi:hypothetical protein
MKEYSSKMHIIYMFFCAIYVTLLKIVTKTLIVVKKNNSGVNYPKFFQFYLYFERIPIFLA